MQKQNRYIRENGESKATQQSIGSKLIGKLKKKCLGSGDRHLQCYNCRFDLTGFEAIPYNSMAFHSILITFRMVCQALKL
ncbi:MAG: hypothetical protein LIP08_08275 [Bacteroides sp.]|nr:hypothetical protein [Bacteroides sp.]